MKNVREDEQKMCALVGLGATMGRRTGSPKVAQHDRGGPLEASKIR